MLKIHKIASAGVNVGGKSNKTRAPSNGFYTCRDAKKEIIAEDEAL
jgi:hypothetical protein